MKDPSKPDGEAVNADGSLKPADQIKWVNSPTDESHLPIPDPNEDMGDASETQEPNKSRVCYYESQEYNKDSPFSTI
jgi:hypothetical protein